MAFQPGKSGNPKGRPKSTNSLRDIIRRLGDRADKDGDPTKWEKVAGKVFDLALKGDLKAIQFLADRAFGKPCEETVERATMLVLTCDDYQKKIGAKEEPVQEADEPEQKVS